MKYLLDTATFLWSIFDERPRLSPGVEQLIADPSNDLLLSTVSVWEIAIKHSLGKLSLLTEFSEITTTRLRDRNLLPLSITHEHALESGKLPFHHKDPFDRLLIAQAQIEKLPIITPDPHFKKYGVEVIW